MLVNNLIAFAAYNNLLSNFASDKFKYFTQIA